MLGDRHCAQAHKVSASIVCFQKREKKKNAGYPQMLFHQWPDFLHLRSFIYPHIGP